MGGPPADPRPSTGSGAGRDCPAAAAAVADAHRREWAFVLAATARVAAGPGPGRGVRAGRVRLGAEQPGPGRASRAIPGAWLTTTARRRAIDLLRRDSTLRRKLPLLIEPDEPARAGGGRGVIPDDRLRLIFTCCHPALAREAQVALTLRLVCGLSTAEVAQAFLVSEPTMAARVTRAKKKISAARIPYRVPAAGGAAGPARRRAHRGAPAVHHRAHRADRGRWSARTWSTGRSTWPGCCTTLMPDEPRGPRPARADAADRRPAGDPLRRRTAGWCCSRIRTERVGPGRRSTRAAGWSAGRCAAAARAGSRCRRRSPRCTPRRQLPGRHRLGADRRASTTCSAGPGRPRSWR